jgi:hypothetical protein
VAESGYSLQNTWPSPRVVWSRLSLPKYLLDLPRVSLSLGPCECLGLSFVCGRVEVDGDVVVARLVRLALRLLPGQVACMAASCCSRVTWRFPSLHASVASPEPCLWAHALVEDSRVEQRLVMRGGDLSYETETCRARWKLVGEAATRVKIGCLVGVGS